MDATENKVVRYGDYEFGFFRLPGAEEIYFTMLHGCCVFTFPLKNGKIQREGCGEKEPDFYPNQVIEPISLKEMVEFGIKAIALSDIPNDPQFWSSQ